jgi:hypothetical protein
MVWRITAVLILTVGSTAGVTAALHAQVAPPVQVWALSAEPTVEIGSIDGDDDATLFSGVRSGVVLRDGTIVVADRASYTVRAFDARGTHLRTFGRRGEGPGEFTTLTNIVRLGIDTIAAHNERSGFHLFSAATGELLRTIGAPIQHGVTGVSWWRLLDSSDRFLLLGNPFSRQVVAGVHRANIAYMTWSAQDGSIDTLGVFPNAESFRESLGDPLPPEPVRLVGRATYHATGGGHIHIGDSATDSVFVFGYDGTLRRVFRLLPRPPLPVTSGDREAVLQGIRDGPVFRALAPFGHADALEARLRAMPIPATHPFFVDLLADELGNAWVRRPAHAGERTAHWDVYAPEGVRTATIEMPAGLRILDRHHRGSASVTGGGSMERLALQRVGDPLKGGHSGM